jgi:hypothetical protein
VGVAGGSGAVGNGQPGRPPHAAAWIAVSERFDFNLHVAFACHEARLRTSMKVIATWLVGGQSELPYSAR